MCVRSGGETTCTSNVIFECHRPQNSAHWAWNVPSTVGVNVNVLVRPGIASRLNRRSGTKKEWITSRDVSVISTGSSTGRYICAGTCGAVSEAVFPETKIPSF